MNPPPMHSPTAQDRGQAGVGLAVADPGLVRDPEARLDAIAAVAAGNDHWLRRYSFWLVFLDVLLLSAADAFAVWIQFSLHSAAWTARSGVSSVGMGLALTLGWLAALSLTRCYEPRFLGGGTEEFRRVGDASLKVTAAGALLAFTLQEPFARGLPVPFLVAGTTLLLLGRLAARAALNAGRARGRWSRRVLVVGGRREAAELASDLCRHPSSGYSVVGAVIPGGDETPLSLRDGGNVPVAGRLARLGTAVLATRADTVAVASGRETTGNGLRLLSYELEGTGVDLLVSPALTNVSGTRVTIRPVAGLPLLHLDEPELSGSRKAVKIAFDLVVALSLSVLLAPLLLALALLVRLTSPGPALFIQQRVGQGGVPFRMYKFRTMVVDAESRLAEVAHLNEQDGLLFKLRADPRVTAIGAFLRKYSLDELPQLWNVLRADMSLVGPRPPLPSEVERYERHTHRRLLVKPGVTGLWQVSGRSALPWEETVRLDLLYVENWSLGMDIAILARTLIAVLARRGAY